MRWFAFLACFLVASPVLAADGPKYDPEQDKKSYKAYENRNLKDGKFRRDTASMDAPFTNEMLAENFLKIALRLEIKNGAEVTEGLPHQLTRWRDGIRYAIGGDGYQPEDVEKIVRFLRRLSNIAGIDIALAEHSEDVNYRIIFVGPKTRRDLQEKLSKTKSKAAEWIRSWVSNIDRPCSGYMHHNHDGEFIKSQILIKAEVSGAFREGCFHEEITQTLGLKNDHPDVRPSIFNDDQEFIRLTAHDEYLLRILYHPRLQAGMTAEEVAPLLPAIIDELRPPGHSCCE